VTAPAVQRAITDFRREALSTGQLAEPVMIEFNPAKTLATVSISMQGSGTDNASNVALATLRNDVIPATLDRVKGVEVHVGGLTAGSKDFNDSMTSHLPIVFGFVLGMAFLLLLVTFRSIVVPLKAIVLNLLSVAAAYGVLKLVFQDGHGENLLGFKSLGGVTSWLPLFLFVILFGLSMDYHVFILSRVREAVGRGERTEDAVAHGIKSTAGVVTSAAVVMVAVFSIFATLSALDFKMMGVGLATAVLIDATIVRAVLLPSAMKLLGERNWYLPRWLQWLPQLNVEGAVPAATSAGAGGPSRRPGGDYTERVAAASNGGGRANGVRASLAGGAGHGADGPVRPGTSQGLGIQLHRGRERVTVVLTGELDLITAHQFREEIASVERDQPPMIVIDLRELRFMDSSGLAELVRATQKARDEQRRVVLVTGSEPIDKVMDVSGVTRSLVETTADPATLDG